MARKKNKPYEPMFLESRPLTPIVTLSALVGTPPTRYTLTALKDPPETALRRFLELPLVELETQSFGSAADLLAVFRNAGIAVHLNTVTRDLYQHMAEKQIPIPERLVVAARLVALAGEQLTPAFMLHGRGRPSCELGCLSLARTSLELAARGGWVALGSDDEPQRLVVGPKLPSRAERRQAQPTATECLARVSSEAMQRWREADGAADAPARVYEWLCRFTHFDTFAVEALSQGGAELRGEAYCGLAYAAWFAAAMASVVMGQRLAEAPRVPVPPPWRLSP